MDAKTETQKNGRIQKENADRFFKQHMRELALRSSAANVAGTDVDLKRAEEIYQWLIKDL